jgi:hypothetical protein
MLRITVVPSPACHFCDDADRVLAELARDHAFALERVPFDTPEGRRLVAVHRPALSPLVLVDGRFFSSGRLPRRKLEALLTACDPVDVDGR